MNDQATEPSTADELHDDAAQNGADDAARNGADLGDHRGLGDDVRIGADGGTGDDVGIGDGDGRIGDDGGVVAEHAEPDAAAPDLASGADAPDLASGADDEAVIDGGTVAADDTEGGSGAADPGPTYRRFDCTDPADATALAAAATAARHAVESGQCVVLPTDTVYGIGADAYDGDAVQRLLDAKGRGRDMPPPVLIADAKVLKALVEDVPEAAEQLVQKFWPGPLTIICTAKSSLRMDLGETRGTVAVRVPDHELTRTLLRQTGPMAVSSANKSGRPASMTCQDAVDQLGNEVAVYLDGGAVGATSGKPSTMIDFTVKDTGQVLRRGALTLAQLREYLPELEDLTSDEPERPEYSVDDLRSRHTLQPPTGRTSEHVEVPGLVQARADEEEDGSATGSGPVTGSTPSTDSGTD